MVQAQRGVLLQGCVPAGWGGGPAGGVGGGPRTGPPATPAGLGARARAELQAG